MRLHVGMALRQRLLVQGQGARAGFGLGLPARLRGLGSRQRAGQPFHLGARLVTQDLQRLGVGLLAPGQAACRGIALLLQAAHGLALGIQVGEPAPLMAGVAGLGLGQGLLVLLLGGGQAVAPLALGALGLLPRRLGRLALRLQLGLSILQPRLQGLRSCLGGAGQSLCGGQRGFQVGLALGQPRLCLGQRLALGLHGGPLGLQSRLRLGGLVCGLGARLHLGFAP